MFWENFIINLPWSLSLSKGIKSKSTRRLFANEECGEDRANLVPFDKLRDQRKNQGNLEWYNSGKSGISPTAERNRKITMINPPTPFKGGAMINHSSLYPLRFTL